jgi:DNA polymerase III alpha subunit (gram-positive type)
MKRYWIPFAATASFVLIAIDAKAASFDCLQAKGGTLASRICLSPQLSELDDELYRVTRQVVRDRQLDLNEVKKANNNWFNETAIRCGGGPDSSIGVGFNFQCIYASYKERIIDVKMLKQAPEMAAKKSYETAITATQSSILTLQQRQQQQQERLQQQQEQLQQQEQYLERQQKLQDQQAKYLEQQQKLQEQQQKFLDQQQKFLEQQQRVQQERSRQTAIATLTEAAAPKTPRPATATPAPKSAPATVSGATPAPKNNGASYGGWVLRSDIKNGKLTGASYATVADGLINEEKKSDAVRFEFFCQEYKGKISDAIALITWRDGDDVQGNQFITMAAFDKDVKKISNDQWQQKGRSFFAKISDLQYVIQYMRKNEVLALQWKTDDGVVRGSVFNTKEFNAGFQKFSQICNIESTPVSTSKMANSRVSDLSIIDSSLIPIKPDFTLPAPYGGIWPAKGEMGR